MMGRVAMALIVAATVLFSSCGGGGGGGSTSAPATPPFTPGPPIAPFATSYQNAKGHGLSRINFPSSLLTFVPDQPSAWGIGDFFQNGNLDIFTAKQNYNTGIPFATVNGVAQYQSDFQFWHRAADGTLTATGPTYKGCLHPRKGVVADFNNDGIPDVFVACHGYDATVAGITTNGGLPGDISKLVLSDGQGGFTVSDATALGFYHGASAADVNGDGWPDIVVADLFDPAKVYFLINQKNGTFAKDTARVSGVVAGPYFSAELLDVDGDGILDLVIGGENGNNPPFNIAETAILYGTAGGTFGATKTVIPQVAGRGVTLDFTLVTNASNQRVLYIDKTADGSAAGTTYYRSETLQTYNLTTGIDSVVLDALNQVWISWWLPVTRNGVNGVAPSKATDPNLFF